jgi:superfamily I DNA and/or RNA helicase
MSEINYGLDPIEIIIRISSDDVVEYNKYNDFSIDQIKADISNKEITCHFQKLSEIEHKIYIPTLNGQFEVFVKWYSVADTYQAIIDKKKKTIFRNSVATQQSGKGITESCLVKIIDINEGGRANRASDEFEELYKKVCKQPVVSKINIQNQQEIWFKWIEAQKAIIQKLQEPIEIIGKPEIKLVTLPYKDSNGNPLTSYEVSINIKDTITSEYQPLEIALKEYNIKTALDNNGFPKKHLFEPDGTIFLTQEEIEKVLDPLISSQFNTIFERENEISAIIKLKNRIDYELNNYFDSINLNVKAEIDTESGFLILFALSNSINEKEKYSTNSKEIRIPNELVEKYNLVRKGIHAVIKTTDNNDIHDKIKNDIQLRDNTYGKILEAKKSEIRKQLIDKCNKLREEGYKFASLYLGEYFSYNREAFSESSFSDEFDLKIRRELIPYKNVVEYNPTSKTLSFDFESNEELERITNYLKSIKRFQFHHDPLSSTFKFKVKTNFIAKKTQKQLFYDKLNKLKGAEFITDLNKKKDESDEGEFSIRRKLERPVYLGKLNSKTSNLKKIVLYLPNTFPLDKFKSEEVINFLKSKKSDNISFIEASLPGDEAKITWLLEAVNKITNPTDEPNGKAANNNLGEFLIDTSKARPILDENKVTIDSEYYHQVKNNELLKLNESQRKAVLASIYCSDLALLQGPPGTGKTTVIAEIIWQIISNSPKHKILLTSETNLAVDNALDRLLNTKGVNQQLVNYTTLIKPLRFGKVGKMDEEGAKYSVDRIMSWLDSTYIAEEIDDDEILTEDYDEDQAEDVEKNSVENNAVQDWMKRIASRAKNTEPKYASALKDWAIELSYPKPEVKILFKEKYFEYCNIIGSTCSSSGSFSFKNEFSKLYLQKNFIHYYKTEKYKESISDINYQLNKGAAEDDFSIVDKICRKLRIKKEELSNLLLKPTYAFIQSLYFSEVQQINLLKNKHPKPKLLSKLVSRHGYESVDEAAKLLDQSNTVLFDTVIMDEASKATPPEMLLPLCFGKRSIIIGDHRQLPPMLNEKDFKEALEESGAKELAAEIDQEFLETSQFERMILNENISSTILARCNIQYRMHPDINNVINQFYLDDGGLEPSVELKQYANDLYTSNDPKKPDNVFSRYHGLYLKDFISPDVHTIWVNVDGVEKREGTSIINEQEIETIQNVLKLLKKSEGFSEFISHWDFIKDDFKRLQEQQIGVITFYGEQKKKLKSKLTGLGIPLKINSVDKFQGMERNIIIVSTVRSNKQLLFKNDFARMKDKLNLSCLREEGGNVVATNNEIGFARLPQRLNVALSRAKRLLIVVGNKDFFEQFSDSKGNPLYKNAINEIRKRGKIIDASELNKLLR